MRCDAMRQEYGEGDIRQNNSAAWNESHGFSGPELAPRRTIISSDDPVLDSMLDPMRARARLEMTQWTRPGPTRQSRSLEPPDTLDLLF